MTNGFFFGGYFWFFEEAESEERGVGKKLFYIVVDLPALTFKDPWIFEDSFVFSGFSRFTHLTNPPLVSAQIFLLLSSLCL